MLPVPLAAMPVTDAVLSLVQLIVAVPILLLFNIVEMAEPLQMVCVDGSELAFTTGFTITAAFTLAPGQPDAVGVTVKFTVCGIAVLLFKTPEIFPEPLAAIPETLALLSLVQLKVVPAIAPLKLIVLTDVPEQILCDAGEAVAFGIGLTTRAALFEITCGQIPPNPPTITL